MSKILIEIVCCSAEDCVEAEAGGADRIELCAAISEGGLTPSIGMLQQAKSMCGLPLMVMIRPRAGGFSYSQHELETMQRDLNELRDNGADGFVFMVLKKNGAIDLEAVSRLAQSAANLPLVCHRAFDVTPNPFDAADQLIQLGFSRILTSGQQKTALEGAETIKQLLERVKGRIEILPGGGIRPENALCVATATCASQIHLAPFRDCTDPTSDLGKPTSYGSHTRIRREDVASTVQALTSDRARHA